MRDLYHIFYDKKDFSKQAESLRLVMAKKYGSTNVVMVPIGDMKSELAKYWNSSIATDRNLMGVAMLFHGDTNAIFTHGSGLASGGLRLNNHKYDNVNVLHPISDVLSSWRWNSVIKLWSCKGGLTSVENNFASVLSTVTSMPVQAMSGSLSYDNIGPYFPPRLGNDRNNNYILKSILNDVSFGIYPGYYGKVTYTGNSWESGWC